MTALRNIVPFTYERLESGQYTDKEVYGRSLRELQESGEVSSLLTSDTPEAERTLCRLTGWNYRHFLLVLSIFKEGSYEHKLFRVRDCLQNPVDVAAEVKEPGLDELHKAFSSLTQNERFDIYVGLGSGERHAAFYGLHWPDIGRKIYST